MKHYIAIWVIALLACLPGRGHAESFTLETYYPSPVGVYTNLTVTSTTVLARDGGGVKIGKTSTPSKLSVSGVVVPGWYDIDPDAPEDKVEGAIYYNTSQKTHRVYKNGSWQDISASVPKGTLAGYCEERVLALNTYPAAAVAVCQWMYSTGPDSASTETNFLYPMKCVGNGGTFSVRVPPHVVSVPNAICTCESGYSRITTATPSATVGASNMYFCAKL
ncbi:MAG: hypothetical protein PHV33_07450 [Elusimicrobiales bacterium]|nr:hypothetical protein [Elusimicrobiales bacterium]